MNEPQKVEVKVHETLRKFKKRRFYTGNYGLEIETETVDSYRLPDFMYWNYHRDGSLRHFGIEYILNQPLDIPDLVKALVEFERKTAGIDFLRSPYTSVHVHKNILQKTWKQVANFIVAYLLLERILAEIAGEQRTSNLFCLTAFDAEGVVEKITDLFRCVSKESFDFVFPEDECKYSALNLACIQNLGSLEIRLFRGETKISAITEWVDIIDKIDSFSSSFSTPIDLVTYVMQDIERLLSYVFGVVDPNWKHLVIENSFYVYSVVNSVQSWDEFGFVKVYTVKDGLMMEALNKLADSMFGTPYAELTIEKKGLVEEEFYLDNEWRAKFLLPDVDM